MRRPALLALITATLLGGCVYYNGMYNANRLARAARKAERDGRTFEANNLWGQVVTRAESVAVRHPTSKYATQAQVLRGVGLSHLEQCPSAVAPLERLSQLDPKDDLIDEASLALGRCQLQLGNPEVAVITLSRPAGSRNESRRHEARLLRARALRQSGRYEEALADLRAISDPRGRQDLLLALVATGNHDEAFALADSLLTHGDSTVRWDSVVVALGRLDAPAASTLVDRLESVPNVPPDVRARRLYEDGVRLLAVDSTRAVDRFHAAAAAGASVEFGGRARLRLSQLALTRVRLPGELPPLADSLRAIGGGQSTVGAEADVLAGTITRVAALADSATPGAPQGDLRLFLAAEAVRDTLGAPLLAASLFRRVVDEWPASPYAPKALLAAQPLDPNESAALRLRSDSAWAENPYVARLRGEDAPGYEALEDSLAAFAAAERAVPPRARPVQRRRPLDEDRPVRRPDRGAAQPAAPGGRRAPEQ